MRGEEGWTSYKVVNFSAISRETRVGRWLREALRLLPKDLVVPIVQGRLRGKRWIVGSGVHGYWLGSYEWEKCRAFEAVIPAGGVVYDVGANVGYYTLLAAEIVGPNGRVVAFEPLPRNLHYLRAHLSLNGVTNVLLSDAAAWDSPGTVRFDPGPDNSEGHVTSGGEFDVHAVTLDEFRTENGLPLPDVIKMDIEGGELHALRGAVSILTDAAPLVFLATHGADVHAGCCALLESLGYQCRPLERTGGGTMADEIIARKVRTGGGV